jgi:hypothetical protein
MSDLTDSELALALNGECHTVEVGVWLAREVKRCRKVQSAVVQKSDLTDSELALALNGECHTVEVIVRLAREVKRYRETQQALGATKRPEMPEIFPFVTALHCEVVLRPKDGKSEDIEMTPDEADRVAYISRLSAGEPGKLISEVRDLLALVGYQASFEQVASWDLRKRVEAVMRGLSMQGPRTTLCSAIRGPAGYPSERGRDLIRGRVCLPD